jgi:hypothetical protein
MNNLNTLSTAFATNDPFNDDSIFQETLQTMKNAGDTPASLANALYNTLFPEWSRDADEDFDPIYSQDDLEDYLTRYWDKEEI